MQSKVRGTFIFFICLLMNTQLKAQNAYELLEIFEYEKAIPAFLEMAKDEPLSEEDQEKLAYCYYITDHAEEGLPYLESIMSETDERAYCWYWKSIMQTQLSDYDGALVSLEKYKGLIDEEDEEVDVLIESCKQIPTWDSIPYSSESSVDYNHSLASSFSKHGDLKIVLMEVGMDSVGKLKTLEQSRNEYSEVLLMKPFQLEDNALKPIKWFDNYPNLTINKIEVVNEQLLFFSAADMINENNLLKAPQIYWAKYGAIDEPIQKINLWKLGGLTDSSSCSFPTFNKNGDLMVFSKQSPKTRKADLYYSNLSEDSIWTTPMPIVSINTFGDELFPGFADSIFYFSTNGRVGYGKLDVYSVPVKDLMDSVEVFHYKSPVNSSGDDFNYESVGENEWYVVSNRKGGIGDDDIWQIKITPPVEEEDDRFEEWVKENDGKKVYFALNSKNGELDSVFIQKAISYSKDHEFTINMVGHTDAAGTDRYNLKLGQQRADNVKMKLVNAGYTKSIVTSSKGERELVFKCAYYYSCPDEGHAQNRFVRITITY